MQQIYRRTSIPKCDFNKVTFRHGCSPVNFLYIFRTLFRKIIYGGLLLYLYSSGMLYFPGVFRGLKWENWPDIQLICNANQFIGFSVSEKFALIRLTEGPRIS